MLPGNRAENRRKGTGQIAAALAAAMLVTAVTPLTGSAHCSVPLDACTVSVSLPSLTEDDEAFDQIVEADVVLDFYQVASAVDLDDFDAYEFAWNQEFASASPETAWNSLSEKAKEGTLTAGELNGFTQSLASVVLDGTEVTITETSDVLDPENSVKVTVPGGMYLVLAHNREDTAVEDYREEEKGVYSTTAEGSSKLYHFSPMLVTAPVRETATIPSDSPTEIAAGMEETPIEIPVMYSNTAADSGNWADEAELVVKVGISYLDSALKITKNLVNHESMWNRKDKVTLVYQIEATKDGEPVFSGAESIVFEAGASEKSVVVKPLPVGAEVTVTEVYPGGDYKSVDPKDEPAVRTVTVTPSDPETGEGMAEARFTNDHAGGYKGGGSVKNTYKATGSESEDGEITWSWDNKPDQAIADDVSMPKDKSVQQGGAEE